jgi:hypothetical protein
VPTIAGGASPAVPRRRLASKGELGIKIRAYSTMMGIECNIEHRAPTTMDKVYGIKCRNIIVKGTRGTVDMKYTKIRYRYMQKSPLHSTQIEIDKSPNTKNSCSGRMTGRIAPWEYHALSLGEHRGQVLRA